MKCSYCTRQATIGPFENVPNLRMCDTCAKVFKEAFDMGLNTGYKEGLVAAKKIREDCLNKRRKKQ